MGKVQSKQGDCFIVNAHFNPVCHQLDEVTSPYQHHRPIVTGHDNNISEMSLSISRDNITMNKRVGLAEDKYPLRVILPPAECQQAVPQTGQCPQSSPSCCEEPVRPEKAEEEKSEKEERQQNKLLQKEENISLTSKDLEKQEFSFTLYDFNGHGKVTKDDISGLVRSIYDALGKTVKLPPSGSRTIKVRLAVDPDTKKPNSESTSPASCKVVDSPVDQSHPIRCSNQTSEAVQSSPSNNLGSVHTLSTYLSLAGEQRTEGVCHQNQQWACLSNRLAVPAEEAREDGQKNEEEVPLLISQHCPQMQEMVKDNGLAKERRTSQRVFHTPSPLPDRREPSAHHRHKHHHRYPPASTANNRDHLPECRERRNHYMDLLGVENCGSKLDECQHVSHPAQTPYSAAEPTYVCPYRILDRTHQCSLGKGELPTKNGHCIYEKPSCRQRDHMSRFLKYRFYSSAPKDDLLNLNFDLCDLVPEEKFDWQCFHQHRRSKSYDMYDKKFPTNFVGSPKPKQKQFRNEESHFPNKADLGALPSSPNHHYRHRNRERERQRAMQQVANWIEKEHLRGLDREERIYASPLSSRRSQMMVECHEHHHLHEHIHHHYHHYVDA